MGSRTRRILHIAPSDYHLFDQWHTAWLSSIYVLTKKSKIESIRGSPQDEQFFQREIRTLLERWEKVVASDGQYFES